MTSDQLVDRVRELVRDAVVREVEIVERAEPPQTFAQPYGPQQTIRRTLVVRVTLEDRP